MEKQPRHSYLVDADERPLGVDNNRLRATVQKLFSNPAFRPPLLPDVANELLALNRSPNVGMDQVTKLLEKDSLLTGKVLKKARTALYASTSPIRTLKEALVRLGLNVVQNLVMEAALDLALFRTKAYVKPMAHARLHLLSVAHLCRLVARRTPVDAEHAFLVGLLHDLGFPVGLVAISTLDADKDRAAPPGDLHELLHDNHEALSASMAKLWNLSSELEQLLERHHRWHQETRAHPVHLVLAIAETLAIQNGLGVEGPLPSENAPAARELPSELSFQRAATELRLNDAVMAALRREAADLIALLQKSAPLP